MKIPDFKKLDKEQMWAWIEKVKKELSEEQFKRLWAAYGKKWAARMETLDKLRDEVSDLFSEVSMFDDGVEAFFDPNSDRMLEKKVRVLKALRDGKSPDEIGKDYFDILEGFDQKSVPDGATAIVGGWEFDPLKYK